jgi:hypothetical protein
LFVMVFWNSFSEASQLAMPRSSSSAIASGHLNVRHLHPPAVSATARRAVGRAAGGRRCASSRAMW